MFVIMNLNFKRCSIKEFFSSEVPDVKFPFKNLYDDKDRKIPIICLSAPFRSDEHKKLYEEYKSSGFPLLGSSSYSEFPGELQNPYEDTYHKSHADNYETMVKAGMYCFREPHKYFKIKQPSPHMLMASQSNTLAKKEIPAVIHKDGTARVQLVEKNNISVLRPILEEWYERTSCPMLLNTSLNIKGKPIVNDWNDASEFEKKYKVAVF